MFSKLDFNVSTIPIDIISAMQQTVEAAYQANMSLMQPANPNQNPVQQNPAGGN